MTEKPLKKRIKLLFNESPALGSIKIELAKDNNQQNKQQHHVLKIESCKWLLNLLQNNSRIIPKLYSAV